MKFFLNAILLSALSTIAFAQSADIGYPPANTTVQAGYPFTVEIDQPDSLTGSTEVALVIGVLSCASRACPPPQDVMGTILYNGPYDPEFRTVGKPPYQNFSIEVPANFAKGPAQLNVAHISLVGAGPFLFTDTFNGSIIIT
jgi:hypothetical protein